MTSEELPTDSYASLEAALIARGEYPAPSLDDMVQAGWTINQYRAARNLPPVEWGNVPLKETQV